MKPNRYCGKQRHEQGRYLIYAANILCINISYFYMYILVFNIQLVYIKESVL